MKTFLWVLLAGLVVSTPAFAHHGNASFDAGKRLELIGTVTEWDWANPHCWLKFDIKIERQGRQLGSRTGPPRSRTSTSRASATRPWRPSPTS